MLTTAVTFFLCLLPFEFIPEIPVDIDSKPFFVPLAFCALLPRRAGLSIGIGVALGEGMRDLMEGYELDDPIGFFGYIAGFWMASQLYALAPGNRVMLGVGAVVCAGIQGAIEASSFLIFGSEGLPVALQSAVGNTIFHGVIWGAVPLLLIVPRLRGRIEPYLGFAPLDGPQPQDHPALEGLPAFRDMTSPGSAGPLARLDAVTYIAVGQAAPALQEAELAVDHGDLVEIVADTLPGVRALRHVLSGAAPSIMGGALAGSRRLPAQLCLIPENPADGISQARPLAEVAAALQSAGVPVADCLARAGALLEAAGLPADRHTAYQWSLTHTELCRVVLAAAEASAPTLLLLDRAQQTWPPDVLPALAQMIARQRRRGAVILLSTARPASPPPEEGEAPIIADRRLYLKEGKLVAYDRPAAPRDSDPDLDQPVTRWPGEGVQVPVLHSVHSAWWRARDPRIKWGTLIALFVLIYLTPSWPLMAGLAGLGAVMALSIRPPLFWLVLAVVVQLPNLAGLVLLPLAGDGTAQSEEFAFGLRLGFGWLAAILFGISILSTMDIPELVTGLRGIGLPRGFARTIGAAFVMIYFCFADLGSLFAGAKPVLSRGDWKRPLTAMNRLVRAFVPALLSVARRGQVYAIATRARSAMPFVPAKALTMQDAVLPLVLAMVVAVILGQGYLM